MEKLIEIFFEVDKNDDGYVDKQEMVNHCKENKLDLKMVDEWLSKCDTDKDGKISLEEFCHGFGIKLQEMQIEKKERELSTASNAPKVPDDVQILDSTMSPTKQSEAINMFKRLVSQKSGSAENMEKVSTEFKQMLEKQYGRVWHVVILCGSFWMSYSHEPFLSLQFKHGKWICSIWRTPSG